MRRNIGAVAVIVAAVALIAGPTQARPKRSQTHIVPGSVQATTTGSSITKIVGGITTEKAKCLATRSVEISSGPSQTLQSAYGSGQTDAQGRFEVTGSAPRDAFFAVQILKVRRDKTVCKGTAHFGQFP